MEGLNQSGAQIIECRDSSWGVKKYINLFFKHWKLRNDYDFLWVGYPGHVIVWFAKLISKKPVIFDALCTMEEGVILSRGQNGFLGLKKIYVKVIDWLAVKCADTVLVESEAQKDFFIKKFGYNQKYKVVYTGANNKFFFKETGIEKKQKFTVLFRGKFLPEAGVDLVVRAAKILEKEQINFIIIGNGFLEKQIRSLIKSIKPNNLILISEHLAISDLRRLMLSAHVSLGQLARNDRLNRTIPHKCFESIALGLPYVTAKYEPILEILKNKESVITFCPGDVDDLVEKIIYLKNNPDIAKKVGDYGYKVYQKAFTPKELALKIISILQKENLQK